MNILLGLVFVGLSVLAIFSGCLILGLILFCLSFPFWEKAENERYYKSETFKRLHPEEYAERERARINAEITAKEAAAQAKIKQLEEHRYRVREFERQYFGE